MINGPCGGLNLNSPCMKDGKCTKRYPRELIHETQTGGDEYPLYKRRKPDEAFHLENGQRVYFTEKNAEAKAAQPPHTILTAFFKLCSINDFTKTLLYPEVPKYYTWNTCQKKFMRRKNGAISWRTLTSDACDVVRRCVRVQMFRELNA
ncbi:hypothetical protein EVAR_74379_1 [Eumeta japonica]|uniref:Uncharacterized protein n=1 Tax=Eumeta variegata TaxID=151549 RepID=A0A4C1SD92_EUMVA|nr:hypothetical protein EVAR_74379_1 [Eumeta japonica]